jgi:hypothetical protein
MFLLHAPLPPMLTQDGEKSGVKFFDKFFKNQKSLKCEMLKNFKKILIKN